MKKIALFLLMMVMSLTTYAQLPSMKLKTTDGKTVEVQKLPQGKPMVISFWATWCKPCVRELKAIHEVYPDWQDETGVEVVIVSVDQAQDAQKVKPMIDGYGWEYRCLLDPNGDLKRAMGVNNVPHIFVLDGKGKIVYNHSGYTDGAEAELYEIIKKL